MTEVPSIPATATAPIFKVGPLFSLYRYTVELHIDDVPTEIHGHARTKRQARKLAEALVNDAAELLLEYGAMGDVYRALELKASQPELPEVGSTIYLKDSIGVLEAGTPLRVIESEWTSEIQDLDYNWPVTAKPSVDSHPFGETFLLPLTVNEFTTEAPVA